MFSPPHWSPTACSKLLADEPTGNLGSTTGAEVLDLLFALHRDRGLTLILATHDPAVGGRCDRVIELSDGTVTSDSASAADSPGA